MGRSTRIPLLLLLLMLVLAACAIWVGLNARQQSLSTDTAVELGVVAVVMFAVAQIPLLFVRAMDHKRIASPDTKYLTPAEESLQFGLRYLLGWPLGVGLLLVLVRQSLPGTIERGVIQTISGIGP